ncbi:inorganic phosphate transporter [Photobacterium sp. MCCC 1A19761]|uniref:inorganic phosphate transporter n=1 Tax=Photobacterium sp. MCCC 1A19761 TaxID=3115000 RepID=UPI00307F0560
MDLVTILLVLVVVLVAAFDFTNGFHDAADMVATAIASRAMKPGMAIGIVTFFTFIAPFSVGLAVADTVGTFVDVSAVTTIQGESLVIAALLAAVSYNLVTWWLGFPSSSSNSLAGGLVGAGLYCVGSANIAWGVKALQNGHLEGVMKVVVGLFVSPFFGFVIGFLVLKLFFLILRRTTTKINKILIVSQYVSVAWLGFSHGANDAQKGMAVIGMMLLASGITTEFSIPVWAIFLCASAITLGTMFGGWRIIKTLGFGLFRVKTIHSVANQLGSALVNTIATISGAPTSTTQVVTATLLGNGAAEKPQHVKWRTARGIVTGWFMNVPVSMALGWLYCFLFIKLWG